MGLTLSGGEPDRLEDCLMQEWSEWSAASLVAPGSLLFSPSKPGIRSLWGRRGGGRAEVRDACTTVYRLARQNRGGDTHMFARDGL